jgi:Fe-S cluster assembly ATP-binding protein
MLEIKNLSAAISNNPILNKLNLTVNSGEVHAIMGPNGSGKSTLANVLAGHPSFDVLAGSITFQGLDLIPMLPEDRSKNGLFLSFQHPIEIPGVRFDHFMRASLNNIRKYQGLKELGVLEFRNQLENQMDRVGIDRSFIKRSVNQGFSGGEKKRFEILQLGLLDPSLAILDEPDSGLDVDALKAIAKAIRQFKSSNKAIIIITHYQRILQYIKPDAVHILVNGNIVRSGSKELADEVELNGYDQYTNDSSSF